MNPRRHKSKLIIFREHEHNSTESIKKYRGARAHEITNSVSSIHEEG